MRSLIISFYLAYLRCLCQYLAFLALCLFEASIRFMVRSRCFYSSPTYSCLLGKDACDAAVAHSVLSQTMLLLVWSASSAVGTADADAGHASLVPSVADTSTLGEAAAVPSGYGSPEFVQQLSSMVSTLEQQNLGLKASEKAAEAAEKRAVAAEKAELAMGKALQTTVDEQQKARPRPPNPRPTLHTPLSSAHREHRAARVPGARHAAGRGASANCRQAIARGRPGHAAQADGVAALEAEQGGGAGETTGRARACAARARGGAARAPHSASAAAAEPTGQRIKRARVQRGRLAAAADREAIAPRVVGGARRDARPREGHETRRAPEPAALVGRRFRAAASARGCVGAAAALES